MLVTAVDGSMFYLKDDGTWTAAGAPAKQSLPAELGFRKVAWGASKSAVKASEDQAWSDSGDVLTFDTSIGGMASRAVFILIDDQFVRAKYMVTETYSNNDKYLLSFASLKTLLVKKYGEPDKDNDYWSDDFYQDDPDEWGTAVGRGDLKKYTVWESAETTVLLALTGENYNISLEIEYSAHEYSELERARTEAKHLEDL